MDMIEIRVESFDGEAVTRPWSAVFGPAGGTIGRGGHNKLVLPDNDAHVARVHAMVRLETDQALIANLCERRAILVGDRELPSGQEAVLPLGAALRIGPYLLRVQPSGTPRPVAAAAADDNPFAFIGRVEAPALQTQTATTAAGVRSRTPPPAGGPLIPDDFDPFARDPRQDQRDKDPWADGLPMHSLPDMAPVRDDLLRSLPAIDRVDQPSPLDRSSVRGLPSSLEPQVELDPMRLFGGASASANLPDASARLLRGSELGQAVRLPQEAVPTATPAAPVGASGPGGPTEPVVPAELLRVEGLDLSMFDRASAAPATIEPQAAPEATIFSHINADLTSTHLLPLRAPPVDTPAAAASVRLALDLDLDKPAEPATPAAPAPASAPAPLPTAPPTAAAAPATAAADSQALLQAFIEGVKLPPERVQAELSPEFMRRLGQMFRTSVQGTMDLLHARSEIKREFRADVTIMANKANNPLKFLPDADGVLMQMFGQAFPGFLRPVPALEEAYRDLRVHQLALMAGIRAAYAEALTRFDPAELEKHAATPDGLLARLGRSRHKAALWDDYKRRYGEIRRNAEDDLEAFSGRTFVKAYDDAADAAQDEDELLLKKPG